MDNKANPIFGLDVCKCIS